MATSPHTTRPRTPGPLARELEGITATLHRYQFELVRASAAFADADEWVLTGFPTPAHFLADLADIEACTAREWIRVGRRIRELPLIAAAFEARDLSYAKVRTLTRFAEPHNEAELIELAMRVPAGALNRELARWFAGNATPDELDRYHEGRRSVTWRNEPDGMVCFTLRLPPHIAAMLIAVLTSFAMRRKPAADASGRYPTLAQQHADAMGSLLDDGVGAVNTEVIFHVRADGCTADDGTPVTETVIADLVDESSLRAMIHDADRHPVNASGKHRHPNQRQKLVVKERDHVCVDCGRDTLLQYDHVPAFEQSQRTIIEELVLRCAPCHQARHAADARQARGPSGPT